MQQKLLKYNSRGIHTRLYTTINTTTPLLRGRMCI